MRALGCLLLLAVAGVGGGECRMNENKPNRGWLSFGIRDLLWATLVVGLAIGWWQDLQKDNEQVDYLKLENRGLKSQVKSEREHMMVLLAELQKCRGEELLFHRNADGALQVFPKGKGPQ
jgi:hypothetical protein